MALKGEREVGWPRSMGLRLRCSVAKFCCRLAGEDAATLLKERNRSLSGVLLQPPSAQNNPSHIHQGGAGSDQGDSDQQQVAAA